MGKCRSKRWQKENRMGGYFQGHGIRKVWGQIQSSLSPISVQLAPRKRPVPLGAPPHPPSSASEPSPFPEQHSLAPEPSPHCSPHPGWPEEFRREGGKKAHNTPGGKKTLPCHLWDCRFSWCQRSEGCGGKPHLSLPLPLPPALHFSLSHFKNYPSTPPHPQKYPPD